MASVMEAGTNEGEMMKEEMEGVGKENEPAND